MPKAKALLLIGALVSLTSCSSFAPVKISAGDQCTRCRRSIHDVRLAGEIVNPNGLVEKFRAPGCMAKYIVSQPSGRADVYVTDFTSGKLFPADGGIYVPVLLDRNTGESDYRAYRIEAEAEVAARELQATAVNWSTVLERAH